MDVRTRLNGLQQMMLRWEEFQALNAAHAVQFSCRHDPYEVERAVMQTCRSLGLQPVVFDSSRRTASFLDEQSDGIETYPLFSHVRLAGAARPALEACLNDQLNRPFGNVPHWPLRFVLLDSTQDGQFLLVSYQHAISDSRGISLVVREILRAIVRLPPRVPHLELNPPPLSQLFPDELGWRGTARRLRHAVAELREAWSCFQPPRRKEIRRLVECGFHACHMPLDPMKETSRALGATVHELLTAALIEGLNLHFAEERRLSRRSVVSIYSPADLRREADGCLDTALGQFLGSLTSRAAIPDGTPFPATVAEVRRQAAEARSSRLYREHCGHMQTMARIWDQAPPIANRTVGPYLLPQSGFVSNVNLTEFLAEELSHGIITDYLRFSGTGLLAPMMLGITTTGPEFNLTTTRHTDVFSPSEMSRLMEHVRWRLTGNTDEPACQAAYQARSIDEAQTDPRTRRPEKISSAARETVLQHS